MQIEQSSFVKSSLRKKYEMLRTILIDDRAKRYGRYSQYHFKMGNESVNAVGFFEYSGRVVNIPNNEIERMGECFLNNPGDEIPKNFYGSEIKNVEYPIENVQQRAQASKQPLNLIKRAVEGIKNVISRKNQIRKEQGRVKDR